MTTLHHLHKLGGNIATLIIARSLLHSSKPLSLKELNAPTVRKQTLHHLAILMQLGFVAKSGIDAGPVAGSGRRPMLYRLTPAGRQAIRALYAE